MINLLFYYAWSLKTNMLCAKYAKFRDVWHRLYQDSGINTLIQHVYSGDSLLMAADNTITIHMK